MGNSHSLQAEIELLRKLKAGLPRFNNNIVFETDPDYATVNDIIAKSQLPLLFLEGPTEVRNPTFTSHQKTTVRFGDEIPNSGGVLSRFKTFTAEDDVDFNYRATILTKLKSDLSNASNEIYGFLLNGKKITVQRCPGEPLNGTIDYEIDLIEKFAPSGKVNNSGLKELQGTIIIRGVKISDDQIFREGFVADSEPNLDTVPK